MSERSNLVLLADMVEAIEAVRNYTEGLDFDTFMSAPMVRDAVVRNVQVLGEAANRVAKPFREQHPQIEWMRIIRSRHVLVHDYFGIDYEIVWKIISVHFPPLRQALEEIIKAENSRQ
ncbi:HepT-like ribonuclease domain-containing protein [Larkinella soli]|uniref:HepT-like ribonuclease domain-containing protein n=1 Tax=Larkinella soli TaxID=1770527 RepID=UPI000FFC3A0F|nr:DUF86 domain-containing protein [Larkinella soli]